MADEARLDLPQTVQVATIQPGTAPVKTAIGHTPGDGEVMTFVAADGEWENRPGGGGGETPQTFNFAIAATPWLITHALAGSPGVSLRDAGGVAIEGDVSYPSAGHVRVDFANPQAGSARLF